MINTCFRSKNYPMQKNGEIEFYSSGDSAVEQNDAVKLKICMMLGFPLKSNRIMQRLGTEAARRRPFWTL